MAMQSFSDRPKRKNAITVRLVGFLLLGTPLIAYLWNTLNAVLEGTIQPLRVLIAIPVAILFYGFLRFMARSVSALEGERRRAARGED